MAASYRQQAKVRKWTYWVLIVALLSLLVAYRQFRVVEDAAERYNISETNIGEVDLGGSAARFALACFRGPLITLLWWEAIELQAKHDWPEMEMRIKALTKLQPHFREPWKYQGWNLAFNVSVEFDSVYHKYFHVAQGINWVADGERKNRRLVYDPAAPGQRREVGDPDLRWSTGWFLYDKMTVADETPQFRIYLALSCIPPKEWDPYELRQNPNRLRELKDNYPRLVRRIREFRSIPEGAEDQLDAEIIRYLTSARRGDFPSLYPELLDPARFASRLAALDARSHFPIWPDVEKYNPADKHREEVNDPYQIAMQWYDFSIEPLPPPGVDYDELDPSERLKYKVPRNMVTLIFRSNPAKAKSHQGRALAREGWLQDSRASWQEAFERWLAYGYANRVELREDEYDRLTKLAEKFRTQYPDLLAQGEVPAYRQNDMELIEAYLAHRQMIRIGRDRGVANYSYWKHSSEYNAKPEALEARRHWYNATRPLRSDLRAANAEFEKGIPYWRQLIATPWVPFLLDLGPAPGVNAGLVSQPHFLYERTAYGNERLAQEEMIELQEQYRQQRAKTHAAALLVETHAAWELAQALGRRLTVAGALAGPGSLIPAGMAPTSIDWVEDVLAELPGPLDQHFDPTMLRSKRMREDRQMPSPSLAEEMKLKTIEPKPE